VLSQPLWNQTKTELVDCTVNYSKNNVAKKWKKWLLFLLRNEQSVQKHSLGTEASTEFCLHCWLRQTSKYNLASPSEPKPAWASMRLPEQAWASPNQPKPAQTSPSQPKPAHASPSQPKPAQASPSHFTLSKWNVIWLFRVLNRWYSYSSFSWIASQFHII
jgi:hypothetical protein